MMKALLSILALLINFSIAYSQVDRCGTGSVSLSLEERQAAIEAYQRAPINFDHSSRNIDSVAVTVQIVKSSGGSPTTLTTENIANELLNANNHFGLAGIRFFLCGSPRILLGDASYNVRTGDELNRKNHVSNTINVFIVENLEDDRGNAVCGFAYYPFSGTQESRYIMMDLSCVNNWATFPHELGHFYGLFHTHDATTFGTEYVDRTNCEQAGDLLCDTPADPNLSRNNLLNGCEYIGELLDPNGDSYKPMVTNFMSYAPSTCRDLFTSRQRGIIRGIHADQNSYLLNNCDFYPDIGVSSGFERIKIQADEDIDITYTIYTEGVTEPYEVDFQVFLRDEQQESSLLLYEEFLQIVPGQSVLSRDLTLDFPISKGTGEYKLQASLDSEFKIIERTEDNNSLETIIEVDNSGLDDFVIFPNPVDDQLKLFFRDKRASGAFDIRVFSYDGKLILNGNGFKNQEEFFQVIDVSNMNKGLYILKIDFEKINRDYVFKFLKM